MKRDVINEAISRAEKHADEDWMRLATDAGVICAGRFREFTSDDIWRLVPGWVQTHDHRAMGAIMRRLRDMGVCEPMSLWRPSQRPEAHGRPIRVWKSQLGLADE